ncbi:MAG: hypothetical protein LC657_15540, partial [Desulfobacteraceae bacterium]|nr:hypothetical protein [Desulfobacteraceae bacterium]
PGSTITSMMVPGMGDKISVLIQFSFVFFVKIIHNTLHRLFGWERVSSLSTEPSNPILKGKIKVKCVYLPVDSPVWNADAGQIL